MITVPVPAYGGLLLRTSPKAFVLVLSRLVLTELSLHVGLTFSTHLLDTILLGAKLREAITVLRLPFYREPNRYKS